MFYENIFRISIFYLLIIFLVSCVSNGNVIQTYLVKYILQVDRKLSPRSEEGNLCDHQWGIWKYIQSKHGLSEYLSAVLHIYLKNVKISIYL